MASNVIVLSYPAYCRYRSTLKRLEGHNHTDYMRQAVVEALGGRVAPGPNTRVVFCKSTFDYPELEDHELLCNHLGNHLISPPCHLAVAARNTLMHRNMCTFQA